MRSTAAALLVLALLVSTAPVRAAERASDRADERAEIERLTAAGDRAAALKRVEAALVDRPRDAQLRFVRGVLLSDLGREGEAIVIFRQLHEDYPELPDPLNNIAVILAGQGRLDEARVALETALRNDARHRTARENLADVYLRQAIRLWDGLATEGLADATVQRKLRLARELLATRS